MNNHEKICAMFGESAVNEFYDRIQYMLVKERQEFIDACIKYKTRPGAGWDGGFMFNTPFIPVRNIE